MFDLFLEGLKEKGKSISDLEKDGVLNKNIFYGFKKYCPSLLNAIKVANYLGLSLDYILERTSENKFKEYSLDQIGVYAKIQDIMDSQNLTPYKVSKALNIAQSNFTDWKRGAQPKLSTLISIVDFLHCDLDDVLILKNK